MDGEPKYKIRIEHDQDVECPCANDSEWQIYSFNDRHNNFQHPNEFFNGSFTKPKFQIARKLKIGLAFVLSYHEHGNCIWSLQGHGPQCQWDTVQVAGIAIWEESASNFGAKTYEDRAKDCAAFLETYTDWCNGNCFYYVIEDDDGNHIDLCGGFIGTDAVLEAIRENLPEDATEENTEVGGECWLHDCVFVRQEARKTIKEMA